MLRRRVTRTVTELRERLEESFIEEHTPREVAGSFAVGVFITALPTLGTGLLLFLLLVYFFEQVNEIALFASVVVLNPVVKWGVYAASFWLGTALLGPVPGVSLESVSVATAGPGVLLRLWVGNLLLAVLFAVVGYAAVLRAVVAYRRERLPLAPGFE
jgi:uncharacterized protein (DUF2062 family)